MTNDQDEFYIQRIPISNFDRFEYIVYDHPTWGFVTRIVKWDSTVPMSRLELYAHPIGTWMPAVEQDEGAELLKLSANSLHELVVQMCELNSDAIIEEYLRDFTDPAARNYMLKRMSSMKHCIEHDIQMLI